MKLTLVQTFDEIQELLRWLGERRNFLAVDIETTGLDWDDTIRTVQFGDANHGWCIDFQDWRGLVKKVMTEYDGQLVMHNFKFDASFLQRAGIPVPWERLHCTMAMSHILEPDKGHGLKDLAVRHLDPSYRGGQQQLNEDMARYGWTWATVPVDWEAYWIYAALDTSLTAQLADRFHPQVNSAFSEIYDLELASTHVLSKMEMRGARIDVTYCRQLLATWTARDLQLRDWCATTFGLANPLAPAQVIAVLQREGVHFSKLTERGQQALDKEVLASIDHPLAAVVSELRQLTKFGAAYLRRFLQLKDIDDLVHCKIHPLGARTGRMSITDPALQTLPRGPEVRDAIIPRDGNCLLLVDYAQIEMRLLAHFAQEEGMIAAIHAGLDMHDYTASQVYRVAVEDLRRGQRQRAKNANFAKAYVAGIAQFSRTAGVSVAEGQAFLELYDALFPGVRRFHKEISVQAETEGCIYSPFGRRHPVDADTSYKAVNYLIQGTAADFLKRRLVELDLRGLADYAVLPVHDEIVFDVPLDEVEALKPEIVEAMEDHNTFSVPIETDAKIVARWGDAYREAS